MSDLDDLLAGAWIAFSKGDKRGAVVLINHILKQDFTQEGAWRLLHQLSGAEEPFEEFQVEFAKKYYPDRAHLLVGSTPSPRSLPPESPAAPKEPGLSESERVTGTKPAIEPAKLIIGGGIVALVLICAASLVIAVLPLILSSIRPQGSPENVARNWIEAAIAGDCDKLESYTAPLAWVTLRVYCGSGAKVQLLEARIDEVLVYERGSDEAEVILIGYFRTSNIFLTGDQTSDAYRLYVRKLNGKVVCSWLVLKLRYKICRYLQGGGPPVPWSTACRSP